MKLITVQALWQHIYKGAKLSGSILTLILSIILLTGFNPLSKKEKPCEIIINTNKLVHPNFGGTGFHVFNQLHKTTQVQMDQVLDKRWRELNPSFARVTHINEWTIKDLDEIANQLQVMKNTHTEIYMTTWDPKYTTVAKERSEYAKKVVDKLEYLIREKGLDNIKYYCMSNEMTLGKWGFLRDNLQMFKDYHQTIFDELKARNLNVGLLATDEAKSGFDEGWPSILWAVKNMDNITSVYGGHHYEWDMPPENTDFYAHFLKKMKWGSEIARKYHKNFILGEFGSRQDTRFVNGLKLDINVYNDTPSEKYITLQTSEMALAAINGGVYGMAYWTFADFPDPESGSEGYLNKWGLFKWSGNNYATRGLYYGYGLLTRFFRGPATVYSVTSNDDLVRVAAVQHHDLKTWSIAVVNRNDKAIPISVVINGMPVNAIFRKYSYNSLNEPSNPFGDMPGPDKKIDMTGSVLNDSVGPLSLTVYTTAYDENPPAQVQSVKLISSGGKYKLTWKENTDPDFCYYRIYKSPRPEFVPNIRNQIGSTIAVEFAVDHDRYVYKVIAVDKSGNTSEPAISEYTIKLDN